MVYLKDAVGNEKLDVALRVLASEQQRKVSSMPPQDGFTQRLAYVTIAERFLLSRTAIRRSTVNLKHCVCSTP